MAISRLGPRTEDPDVVGDVNAVLDEIEAALDTLASAPVRLVGEIAMWPMPVAPTNWLILDGRTVSRTTYADLYAFLGDTYGAGDGSTTFNLPDATDVVIMGAGSVGVAGRGGSMSVTLAAANLPPHIHSMDHDHPSVTSGGNSRGHVHDATHSHQILTRTDELGTNPNRVANSGGGSHAFDNNTAPKSFTGNTQGENQNHTHSVNVPSFAGDTGTGSNLGLDNTPVDITPAHLRLHFIIYAGV